MLDVFSSHRWYSTMLKPIIITTMEALNFPQKLKDLCTGEDQTYTFYTNNDYELTILSHGWNLKRWRANCSCIMIQVFLVLDHYSYNQVLLWNILVTTYCHLIEAFSYVHTACVMIMMFMVYLQLQPCTHSKGIEQATAHNTPAYTSCTGDIFSSSDSTCSFATRSWSSYISSSTRSYCSCIMHVSDNCEQPINNLLCRSI